MAGIIWLASYPKSGNTWVRLFVENLMSETEADINARKLFGVSEAAIDFWHGLTDLPLHTLSPIQQAALRPRVHQRLAELSDGNVLVKTHNALIEYGGVPMISTGLTAGAVYVVRNPLDVCLSCADHYDVTIDRAIAMMADETMVTASTDQHAFECLSSWSTHVESWTATPHPQLLVVRYEDLHQQPLETFGRIARHLGRAATPERLQQAIEQCAFDRLQEQEKQSGFIERSPTARRFFRDGRSGQWKSQLDERQVRRIVREHGSVMKRFGYLDATGKP